MRTCHSLIRRALRVGALGASLLTVACGKAAEPTATADSSATIVLGPRDVATVSLQAVTSGITITGSLDPSRRVEVKSQIAGQIERVTLNRGNAVRRGQLLATIDARGVRAQSASAEASLAAAERDLRAADTLFKAGAISERDHAQAMVARDAARAQLTQARETLSRATVVSPITGIVSDRSVQAGEAVQTATLLFTIVNTDSLELAGRVAPDLIGGVRLGQSVRLSLDAYDGRVIMGRVARIEPVAEPGTRQVAVYVQVPNPRRELVAGLFATGVIVGQGAATPVPTVPETAVRTSGGESALYVVDGETIARRVVTLGARDAERGLVEVRSGVQAGDRVLVNAPAALQPGARVRVIGDTSAAAPATSPTSTGGR